jgi:hypothetical protein
LSIENVAGGWASAQKVHFADGGRFDQIYQPGRKEARGNSSIQQCGLHEASRQRIIAVPPSAGALKNNLESRRCKR